MNLILALRLFVLSGSLVLTSGDALDDAIEGDILTLNVRGAGVVFFDSVTNTLLGATATLPVARNQLRSHPCVTL